MSRKAVFFTVAVLLATASWQSARADNEPLYRPDGTITFRDWGLYRPGVPTLVEGPYVYYGRSFGNGYYYFPSNCHDPAAYRSPPPAGKPIPAEPYFRSWGTQSDMSAPAPAMPDVVLPEGPSVIYAPESRERRRPESKRRSERHRERHHAGHAVHRHRDSRK